jgi:DNA repair exonuclease SbcCD ATPase subunit
MNIKRIRSKVDQLSMKKQFVVDELASIRKKKENAEKTMEKAVKCLAIAREVAQLTQQQLEQQLSDIVTPAIQAIFGKPYVFKIKYVQKRKKTEAEIYLIDENENEYNPMEDNGGGICDVVALALRLACWKISSPQSAPILFFDEPLKFVSLDYYEDTCEFLIEIIRQLKLQVIMVTHVRAFINAADNIIRL